MSKHTPGPWERVDCAVGYAVHPVGNTMGIFGRVCDDDRLTRGDADLIAAAPDLLAALKELLDAPIDGGMSTSDAIDNARAAIAKAEGRT